MVKSKKKSTASTNDTTESNTIQYPKVDFSSNDELLNWSKNNPYATGAKKRNPMHSHDSFATSGWGIDKDPELKTITQNLKYKLHSMYTRYELITDTYMLEVWEKIIFNLFFLSFVLATAYIVFKSVNRLL